MSEDIYRDYWFEAVCQGADEADVTLNYGEAYTIAWHVQQAHEHYQYAFYQPPDSEYYDTQERKHKASIDGLEKGFKERETDYERRLENCRYEIRRLENIIYDLRRDQ